jgi:ATP:ADP antiporter, AAA family
LVPRLFVLSTFLILSEWALVGSARRIAAVLVYLHFTALGAILVSGFWAIVNERFDPRTARRTIARITAGGSLGGLLGGILPERVGAGLPLTAMLPILAVLTLLAAGFVRGVGFGSQPRVPPERDEAEGTILAAGEVLRKSSYLTSLALLVALTSSAEGVLDFVFKARASAAAPTGEVLLRFFAAFYTATALIGILIQVTVLRSVLGRLGIGRSASLLPAGVSVGAVGALIFPGLTPVLLARGVEVVLRSSLFRAAYELLFTPVAPLEKRATKLLLDVGAARVGDVLGGGLILVTLALAQGGASPILLTLTCVLSGSALLVARRLNLGYVSALAGSIQRQAGDLPDPTEDDAAAWMQTVGGFDLSGIRSRLAVPPSSDYAPKPPTPELPPTAPETPLEVAVRAGEADQVRRILAKSSIKPGEIETAIELLAWDAVAPAAIRSLAAVAPANTDVLLQHLLDPEEDFAIRRRLVNVLAGSRSIPVFEGLLQALGDRRFEVRYRAGRALSQMAGEIRGLVVDRARVQAVILKELEVERGVWESRQLIDVAEEETSPMEAEVLRDRVSRSLEHVFTLLSLLLPRETLRLAFHALHTSDPYLRGTALEYLETVLPDVMWQRLAPVLEDGEVSAAVRHRGSAEALQELIASRESISVALAEARRRSFSEPGPEPRGQSPRPRP